MRNRANSIKSTNKMSIHDSSLYAADQKANLEQQLATADATFLNTGSAVNRSAAVSSVQMVGDFGAPAAAAAAAAAEEEPEKEVMGRGLAGLSRLGP
ncbi:hypothetical protein NL676_003219 [Syzygium grande]|nr:hypothetical protein NL676_003219 [Syzygium grande]